MPEPHRSPRQRSRIVAVIGAVMIPLLVPAVAAADDGPSSGETVVGELVQAWPEHEDHAEAVARAEEGPLTWIETDSGASVRVTADDLEGDLPGTGVPVGATVAVVVGDEVEDHASTEDGMEPAVEVLSAEVVTAPPADEPPLAAAATDVVTVVMMIPARGIAETGRTLAQVEAAVNTSVAAFWSGQSGDAVRITAAPGNDPAWFQATNSCSNPSGLWNEAAAHAGWTRGAGKHLLVYLPRNSPGCAYGLAEVGSSLTGGGRLYVTDVATSVIAHELGHNFGLGHSSGVQCDRTVESGTCQTVAYQDYYDVMGVSWQQVGTLNTAQASRLGLVPAGAHVRMDALHPGGSVTLVPVSAASGTRALTLVDSGGVAYWLEYRQASGQDAWLGDPTRNTSRLDSGVTLRRAALQPNTSLLLDATPSASAGWSGDRQVALPVGNDVPVSDGEFHVVVRSMDASGAVVDVVTADDERQSRAVGSVSFLRSKAMMFAGESLRSANGRYQLVFQSDGNLVVYEVGGRVVWASSSAAPGGQLVAQADGNLVIYSSAGRAVWASRTAASGGTTLLMQDDGNLVQYSNGAALWATGGDRTDLMLTGRVLQTTQVLSSLNGQYQAVMQGDGNLVVYRRDGAVVFASHTAGRQLSLVMQPDGNVVIYAVGGVPLWATRTGPDPRTVLVMQDDGNLVAYRSNGTPAWASR